MLEYNSQQYLTGTFYIICFCDIYMYIIQHFNRTFMFLFKAVCSLHGVYISVQSQPTTIVSNNSQCAWKYFITILSVFLCLMTSLYILSRVNVHLCYICVYIVI